MTTIILALLLSAQQPVTPDEPAEHRFNYRRKILLMTDTVNETDITDWLFYHMSKCANSIKVSKIEKMMVVSCSDSVNRYCEDKATGKVINTKDESQTKTTEKAPQ